LDKSEHVKQNLILIGPMGSGKSTVGRRLAARLGKQFVDCDQALEAYLNVDVATIFDIEGERGFREREHQMLKRLCAMSNVVIATGGGCVARADNLSLLRENGLIIYLRTSVKHQLARLSRDKSRPLLQAPDRRQRLHEMAAQRDPLYTSIADLVVESGAQSVAQMAAHVSKLLQQQMPEHQHRRKQKMDQQHG
jgi:shikimate kinase